MDDMFRHFLLFWKDTKRAHVLISNYQNTLSRLKHIPKKAEARYMYPQPPRTPR